MLFDVEEVRDFVLLAVSPTREHAVSEMAKLKKDKEHYAKLRASANPWPLAP